MDVLVVEVEWWCKNLDVMAEYLQQGIADAERKGASDGIETLHQYVCRSGKNDKWQLRAELLYVPAPSIQYGYMCDMSRVHVHRKCQVRVHNRIA